MRQEIKSKNVMQVTVNKIKKAGMMGMGARGGTY